MTNIVRYASSEQTNRRKQEFDIEKKKLGISTTICISNFVDACNRADQHQGKCQQKPVYDRDINLTHELARCMNDFKARETTK